MNIKLVADLRRVIRSTLPTDSLKSLSVSDFNVPASLGFRDKETNNPMLSVKHRLEISPDMFASDNSYLHAFNQTACKLIDHKVYLSDTTRLYSTAVEYEIYIDVETKAVCARFFNLPTENIVLDISFVYC